MRRSLALAVIAGLVALVLPLAARADAPDCEWLAGDFHVHTIYSHDSWGPESGDTNTDPLKDFPEELDKALTLGWTVRQEAALAASRQLDFISITDHDDVRAQTDDFWGTQEFGPLIWVPNYENTVQHGAHAQMHGATHRHFEEYEAATDPVAAASRLEELDGGAFQINHPDDLSWHDPDTGGYRYGDWAPHALEIWNIGAWFYEPPMPATNDHEMPLKLWNEFLNRGVQVAGTGGSDSHWRSTTAAQGIGQPTTWVCVDPENQTSDGILEGVKAGRTSISHQPPAYQGARAYLEADEDGDGTYEAEIGDTVLPGSSTRVLVENAQGAVLRVLANPEVVDPDNPGGERVLAESSIDSFNYALTIEGDEMPADVRWLRAEIFYPDGREQRQEQQAYCDASEQITGRFGDDHERNLYCENRLAMIAMTSPIYFAEPEVDPTTLRYVGDYRVKVGDHAEFAAVLTDANGDPLTGQVVMFTFRDEPFEATTDEHGRASVTTLVTGPPREDIVYVDFAGTDTYGPSHLEQAVAVTGGPRTGDRR